MRMPIRIPEAQPGAPDLVALGECSLDAVALVDRWPGPGAKAPLRRLAYLPGGQAATAALTCQRLGWSARFLGSIGNDWAGERALADARAAGVDVRVVTRAGIPSRQALVIVDASRSDRTVLELRDDRLAWTLAELGGDDVIAGRILLVDATAVDAALQAARAARTRGQPVIVDVDTARPGVTDLLRLVDVLIVPRSAIEALAGTAEPGAGLRRLAAEFDSRIAIVTLGAEGSVALSGGQEIRTPAPVVTVVDTTGAGDAFRGGFAAGWLLYGPDGDLADVLRYANAVAACSCRGFGAQGSLPTHGDVGGSV